ncbi:MAG: response regulator [Verrucomicrobiaceae bacterium]|nr:MAG: response regulator [Verrucomicrobiaceae bacterium]
MRILIADDDRDLADALAEFVRECNHEVVDKVTGGGLAVIQSFARHNPDVVLLDIMMPRFNGITVCHALLSRKPETKIIFVSGKVEGDHPFVAGCGATAYLQKPILLDDLRVLLNSLAGIGADQSATSADESGAVVAA